MYNDIPTKYQINDNRKYSDFKLKTFNGYKKTEVFNELKKNILSSNIDKCILWTCEIHASGYILQLYNRLFSIYTKHVNIANIQFIPILYNSLKKSLKIEKQHLENRNNQYFRNNINDLVCLLTYSNKNNLPKLPKLSSDDFNMTNNKGRMITKNLDFIQPFIHNHDNKNIIIPLSEIGLNLQQKGLSKSLENCLFWLNWLIIHEHQHHKKNMKCGNRNITNLNEKYQYDFTWVLWSIILHILNNTYTQFLYKLYKLDFKKGNKKKKIDLIIMAFMMIIDTIPKINYSTLLIDNTKMIARIRIISNINFQYFHILHNKQEYYEKNKNKNNEEYKIEPYFSKDIFINTNNLEKTVKQFVPKNRGIINNKKPKPKPKKIQIETKTIQYKKIEPTNILDDYEVKPSKIKYETIYNKNKKKPFSLKNSILHTELILNK